jgi:hypothetical protein
MVCIEKCRTFEKIQSLSGFCLERRKRGISGIR